MPFGPYAAGTTRRGGSTPFSVGDTIIGALHSYASGGGASGAAQFAAGAIGTAIAGPVGGLIGGYLGGLIGTKSKANWNRTGGRIARAVALGYVPPIAGYEGILRQLKQAWLAQGDSTGAQFWDRVVQFFSVPTEKGGTKEGFNSGAPAGSKTAEKMPGYKQLEASVIAALG